MKKILSIALLCSTLLLSSCGASAGDEPSNPTSASESGEKTDNSRGEPSVGDRALKLGQTRHGGNADTTVVEVVEDLPVGDEIFKDFLDEENGDRWFTVFVRYCVTKEDNSAEPLSIAPQNISIGTPSGAVYETPASYHDNFPSPRLPDTSIRTGCREGWVNFAIKDDDEIDRVYATDFLNSNEPYAEWRF